MRSSWVLAKPHFLSFYIPAPLPRPFGVCSGETSFPKFLYFSLIVSKIQSRSGETSFPKFLYSAKEIAKELGSSGETSFPKFLYFLYLEHHRTQFWRNLIS